MTRPERIALKDVTWVLCLLPLTILAFRTFTGDLGANPISCITDWLGQWTFRLLRATLALTPFRILFGLSWPTSLCRLLGQMIVRAPVRRPGGDSSVADGCPAGYQGRGRPGSHREQYPGLRTIRDVRMDSPGMVPDFVPRVFQCCQEANLGGCHPAIQTDRFPRSAGSAG